jgi:hypothetical protein
LIRGVLDDALDAGELPTLPPTTQQRLDAERLSAAAGSAPGSTPCRFPAGSTPIAGGSPPLRRYSTQAW